MTITHRLIDLMSDGRARTTDELCAAFPDLKRQQITAVIRDLRRRVFLEERHTYQITQSGLGSVKARKVYRPPQERKARRASRRKEVAVTTIVGRALAKQHPLHSVWGGARQGAGA